MIEDFLKDKKKAGILAIAVIIIAVSGIIYYSYGFKELNKNDTETIFAENGNTEENDNKYEDKNFKTSSVGEADDTQEKVIVVEIKGEVKNPDVYTLKENSIIKDLIEKAGGLTEKADISSINRAKQLQNHELVVVSNKDEAANNQAAVSSMQNISSGITESVININSATIDELKTLNGVGDSKAKSIIEYREKNGPFKTIEDLKNVDGIGEKMFEKVKERITV